MTDETDKIEAFSDALYDDLIKLRKQMKTQYVKPNTVYLADAAELCNIGVVGNQVHQILIKQKIVDAINNADDLMSKYLPYLTIMSICAAVVLIGILVVDYTK